MTETVGGIGVAVHEVVAARHPPSELLVTEPHPGVDDVDRDPRAGGLVGIRVVQRAGRLVDAVQPPRRAGLRRCRVRLGVGRHRPHPGIVQQRADRLRRQRSGEAVEHPVVDVRDPSADPRLLGRDAGHVPRRAQLHDDLLQHRRSGLRRPERAQRQEQESHPRDQCQAPQHPSRCSKPCESHGAPALRRRRQERQPDRYRKLAAPGAAVHGGDLARRRQSAVPDVTRSSSARPLVQSPATHRQDRADKSAEDRTRGEQTEGRVRRGRRAPSARRHPGR